MPSQTDTAVPRQILSPSALLGQARNLLETSLGVVWLEGEISNFSRAPSGHLYFALKDASAQLRCALFRRDAVRLRLQPADGMQVLARGKISIYEARGDLQLIVEHLEAAGLGRLQRELSELKAKLAAEGLLDPARKRPIPRCPRHLAIISSPTAAALQDVLAVLRRRWPLLRVTLYPSRVQGEGAAAELRSALERAVASGQHDLLLLTRGGGSIEDLWAFNDERLARAIAASPVPVISAVGHETDTTLSDMVADLRAATPTAAAELLSPDQFEWLARLAQAAQRIERSLERRLRELAQHLDAQHRRLQVQHPRRGLEAARQGLEPLPVRLRRAVQRQHTGARVQLDQLLMRLRHTMRHAHAPAATELEGLRLRLDAQHPGRRLEAGRQRLQALPVRLLRATRHGYAPAATQLRQCGQRLRQASPARLLAALQGRLDRSHGALKQSISTALDRIRQRLLRTQGTLEALNPRRTVARGYAIVRDQAQRVVDSTRKVSVGARLSVELAEGSLDVHVDRCRSD